MDASPISRWTLGQIASAFATISDSICNIPGADLACLHCVCAINVFKSHLDRLRWTQVLDRLRATRPAPQKSSVNIRKLELCKRKSTTNASDISTVIANKSEHKVKHWLESNVKMWTVALISKCQTVVNNLKCPKEGQL